MTTIMWDHASLLLCLAGLCMVNAIHQPIMPEVKASTPSPSKPAPINRPNCTLVKPTRPPRSMLVDFKLLPGSSSHNLPILPVQQGLDPNCSTSGESVKVLVSNEDHWKTHVIIACTVTATVECSIVVFIVLYWRQIRWTMRKLACPCARRQRSSSQHQRVSTSDPDDTTDMDHAPEEAAVIIDMEPVASTSAAGMGQIATSQV